MKRTSLTNKQRDVLERLLAQQGPVVTSAQISQQLSYATEQSERRFIAVLRQAGWLVRIKKGLYQIADLSSLGSLTLSRFTIAQLLVPESYISFEAALQQHGLFDQGLEGIRSVSRKQHTDVVLEGTKYSYVTTTERYFFGYTDSVLDGRHVRIATPEKAVLDLLQFGRTQMTVDVVKEILLEHQDVLHRNQLIVWAQRLPIAIQRVVGFLLDTTGQSAGEQLHASVQKEPSVSRLTRESSVYDSRWRLYIDPYFVDQKDIS